MLEEKVKVYKIRENAKLPARAHATDAGMDLFFAPEDRESVVAQPGQSLVLGTGLKITVPIGHMLQIMNKSGVAAKRQLVTGACVVDRGYNGEIFINLQNIGQQPQTILPGTKLAQGVFIPVSIPIIFETEEDKVYSNKTDRGDGAFGSTGE
jgi:dUTP pyrophosphatase